MDKVETAIKVAEMAEPIKRLDGLVKILKQLNSVHKIKVYDTDTVVSIEGLSEEDMEFIKLGLTELLTHKRNLQAEKLQNLIEEELK